MGDSRMAHPDFVVAAWVRYSRWWLAPKVRTHQGRLGVKGRRLGGLPPAQEQLQAHLQPVTDGLFCLFRPNGLKCGPKPAGEPIGRPLCWGEDRANIRWRLGSL